VLAASWLRADRAPERAGAPRALPRCTLVAFRWAWRAALWQSETRLLPMPRGTIRRAARRTTGALAALPSGTGEAIASLRIITQRGIDRFSVLERDLGWRRSADPEFRDLVRELARRIELAKRRGYASQPELRCIRARRTW
jgi:hypothetical protein